ncbi:hypothetical protein Pint_05759 [Pistacia integerrima]|uniref:Uncharacterized protein n=1 Tax=Pistacia integerrima TaxID=434235 RepID=A0ACC0ZAJ5_9ROSI|nr:hypothetical protein Pint_05759 [Pistacia integerrima]
MDGEPIPSATTILMAGMKIKIAWADSILDITFSNGVLEIPPLLLHETTEIIFRNLVSFEQCFPSYSPIVTSYAIFMDKLIHTETDMKITLYE